MVAPKPEGSPSTIGVLIVDDHIIVRSAVRLLIEKQPGLAVVGEAGNKAEAVAIAKREQPEIILLDLCLGEEDGIDAIPELLAVSPESKIIMLTGARDHEEHMRAVRQGAMGVVTKEAAVNLLLKAIERVHKGELWLDRNSTAALVSGLRREVQSPKETAEPDAASQLTSREREIIGLVGKGLRNKQIADRLCISEATVRHHLTSILKKLDVCDRLELLIFAYENNLVSITKDKAAGKVPAVAQASARTLN